MHKKLFLLVIIGVFLGLPLISAQNFTWPFTTAGNYTYNSTLINVTGGNAKLVGDIITPYAHWHLNETSGTNAFDSSGNGRNCTTVSTEDSDWVAGKLDNALDLDGDPEYLDCNDVASFNLTDSFSLEMWYYMDALGTGETLFSKRDTGANHKGYDLFKMNTNKLRFDLINTLNTNHIRVETPTISAGQWHHIVVTYDGSADVSGVHIYLNNVDQSLTTLINNLNANTVNTVDLRIGEYNGGGMPVIGKIDEVVIYDQELTVNQVDFRWNTGNGIEDLMGDYSDANPTIVPNNPFTFSTPISSFIETSTIPSGAGIKYHISYDNGSTWYWWNSTDWTTTDGTYSQANDDTDVNTQIGTLNSTGIFKFRAILHSTLGLATALLDQIFVSAEETYPEITSVTATPSYDSATITWTTDVSSNSSIQYGLTTALGSTNGTSGATTSHSVIAYGLTSLTTYYYNVTSCFGNNCNTTGTYSFTTTADPVNTINRIDPDNSWDSEKPPVFVFKTNDPANLSIVCFTNETEFCSNGDTCSLSVWNPDHSVLLSDTAMTFTSTSFYYPFAENDLSQEGSYRALVVCEGNNIVDAEFTFEVTPNGTLLTEAKTRMFFGGITILLVLLAGSVFGIFKTENYIGKFSFYWLSHLLLVALTFSVWQFTNNYNYGFTGIAGIFKVFFYFVTIAVLPMMFLSIFWIYKIHVLNLDVQKMIERGVDQDEAYDRARRKKGW